MLKIRSMNRTVVCILMFVLLYNHTFSQKNILQTTVSIPTGTYSSVEILQKIQQTSGIQFSYKTKLLQDNAMQIGVSSAQLQEILLKITQGKDLDFVVINGVVVVKTKKDIQKIIKKTQDSNPTATIEYVQKPAVREHVQPTYVILSGKLKNAVSGELVGGAILRIDTLNIEVQTNEYGFFSCKVPQGMYMIRITHESFFIHEYAVTAQKNSFVDIGVVQKTTELSSAKADMQYDNLPQQSNIHFEIKKQNTHIPKSILLQDPMKEIGKIPGIQFVNDLSSNVLVRGGTAYQNLVLFDDAPIFNPTHLFGFFSTSIPYSIKDVTIYKGDAPANYGGRLSSVIDIRLKEANENQLGLFTELSPVATTISIESPIIKQRAAVVCNFRKSNLRWLFKDSEGNAIYSFYDAQLKLHMHSKKRHHIYYSFYSGGDDYNKSASKTDGFGISWGNVAHSIRWNYIISPHMFSNLTWYQGTYNYYLYIPNNEVDYWNSRISSSGIKQDFTMYFKNIHTIKYGFEISGTQSNPGNLHYSDSSFVLQNAYTNTASIGMLAMYVSHEYKISPKLSFIYGLRIPISRNGGTAVQYVFEQGVLTDTLEYSEKQTYNPQQKIEPKFQLYYAQTPYLQYVVKASQTTQFIHGISNSETSITSLDVWLPATVNLLPQKARLYSVGFQYMWYEQKIIVQSDVFYKKMLNQWYPKNHARMLLNPYVEGEMTNTSVITKGIETMLQRKGDKLSAWLSYTYTSSMRKIEQQTIPTMAHRPHDISIGTLWKPVPKISVELQWNYLSGNLQTVANGYYEVNGTKVPYYDSHYNYRLPAYHTLDVSTQFHLYKHAQSKWKHILTLQIYNVYARKNAFSVTYNKVEENQELVVPTNVYSKSNYVSSMLYAGTIIPMISYAIKFN